MTSLLFMDLFDSSSPPPSPSPRFGGGLRNSLSHKFERACHVLLQPALQPDESSRIVLQKLMLLLTGLGTFVGSILLLIATIQQIQSHVDTINAYFVLSFSMLFLAGSLVGIAQLYWRKSPSTLFGLVLLLAMTLPILSFFANGCESLHHLGDSFVVGLVVLTVFPALGGSPTLQKRLVLAYFGEMIFLFIWDFADAHTLCPIPSPTVSPNKVHTALLILFAHLIAIFTIRQFHQLAIAKDRIIRNASRRAAEITTQVCNLTGPSEVFCGDSRPSAEYHRLERSLESVWQAVKSYHRETSLLQQDLLRQKAATEAAQNFQKDILLHMSHHIRTPLSHLQGMVAELEGLCSTTAQMGRLKVMHNALRSLSTLLNGVLDFNRLQLGELILEPDDIAFGDILDELAGTLYESARTKHLEVASIRTPTSNLMIADGLRLRQVVANLMRNALKFTDRGSIFLLFHTTQEKAHLVVSDTGIGMSQETVRDLFACMTSAARSKTGREGVGLGLSSAYKLLQMMGGSINVHSTPGAGSCFHCQWPLQLPAAQPPVPVLRSDQKRYVLVCTENLAVALAFHLLFSSFNVTVLCVQTVTQLINWAVATTKSSSDSSRRASTVVSADSGLHTNLVSIFGVDGHLNNLTQWSQYPLASAAIVDEEHFVLADPTVVTQHCPLFTLAHRAAASPAASITSPTSPDTFSVPAVMTLGGTRTLYRPICLATVTSVLRDLRLLSQSPSPINPVNTGSRLVMPAELSSQRAESSSRSSNPRTSTSGSISTDPTTLRLPTSISPSHHLTVGHPGPFLGRLNSVSSKVSSQTNSSSSSSSLKYHPGDIPNLPPRTITYGSHGSSGLERAGTLDSGNFPPVIGNPLNPLAMCLSSSGSMRTRPQSPNRFSDPSILSKSETPGFRFLVTDDNAINRHILTHMLTSLFPTSRCVECADGEAAVEAYRQATKPFHAILMDLYMPGMDGYAAVAAIRALEEQVPIAGPSASTVCIKRVPIFAVTAHASAEDQGRCLREGFDVYLTKPVSKPTLLRTLNSFLGLNSDGSPTPTHSQSQLDVLSPNRGCNSPSHQG